MSSASAPTDSVGSRSNIGTNAAARIRAHPHSAVARADEHPSAHRGVCDNGGNASRHAGECGSHRDSAKGGNLIESMAADRAQSTRKTAGRQRRVGRIQPRGPDRVALLPAHLRDRFAIRAGRHSKTQSAPAERRMPRARRDRARAAHPGALRLARADRDVARIGEDRITARAGCEQQATRGGEKRWRETSGQSEDPPSACVQ